MLCQRLRILNLNHNHLSDLPFAAMAALSNLSTLLLAHNRLVTAPFELFRSPALSRIDLQGNEQLTSPPPRVVNDPNQKDAVVAFLRLEAKALQSGRLLLQGHKMEHFPMEMFRIPEVTEINLSENRLAAIAPEIETLQVGLHVHFALAAILSNSPCGGVDRFWESWCWIQTCSRRFRRRSEAPLP